MDMRQPRSWTAIWLVVGLLDAALATGGGRVEAVPGNRQKCANDGEPVITRFDPEIVTCFPCVCKGRYRGNGGWRPRGRFQTAPDWAAIATRKADNRLEYCYD
ncbi:hypothetical protein HUJ05_011077 [Dendroctonus ponderosae]|nr:hypothetical protein HUJ05_011077 [Dendroctonus ponderosae]